MPVVSRAAIGFSSHLGWAAAVAVAGTKSAPRFVLRQRVLLSNKVHESHEPYHKAALVRDDLPRSKEIVRRGRRAIEACARSEVAQMTRNLEKDGHRVVGAGVLQAGGREMKFESILASHVMVHTAEGALMREALAKAFSRNDLPVLAIKERELFARASERLKLSEKLLRNKVNELGTGIEPPWGSDQKNAALIAWLALCGMK